MIIMMIITVMITHNNNSNTNNNNTNTNTNTNDDNNSNNANNDTTTTTTTTDNNNNNNDDDDNDDNNDNHHDDNNNGTKFLVRGFLGYYAPILGRRLCAHGWQASVRPWLAGLCALALGRPQAVTPIGQLGMGPLPYMGLTAYYLSIREGAEKGPSAEATL